MNWAVCTPSTQPGKTNASPANSWGQDAPEKPKLRHRPTDNSSFSFLWPPRTGLWDAARRMMSGSHPIYHPADGMAREVGGFVCAFVVGIPVTSNTNTRNRTIGARMNYLPLPDPNERWLSFLLQRLLYLRQGNRALSNDLPRPAMNIDNRRPEQRPGFATI